MNLRLMASKISILLPEEESPDSLIEKLICLKQVCESTPGDCELSLLRKTSMAQVSLHIPYSLELTSESYHMLTSLFGERCLTLT
jgi:hypothetical protein